MVNENNGLFRILLLFDTVLTCKAELECHDELNENLN